MICKYIIQEDKSYFFIYVNIKKKKENKTGVNKKNGRKYDQIQSKYFIYLCR